MSRYLQFTGLPHRRFLQKKIYEPKTIEYMMANCRDGDIVHAGTYFGDFLPALSQACHPDAKIWAFEPNSENYRCAEITLLINDIDDVELTNAGLGEDSAELAVLIADKNGVALGGSSQIVARGQSGVAGKTEPARIVTIDDSVPSDRFVSIIQLDVEGYEQQALLGGMQTIRRCLPIIILEVLPGSKLTDSKWFSENILNLGYKPAGQLHGNSVFVCRD